MKIIILAILVVASNLISSGSLAQTTPTKKPKIIVGLMVDQMRWDYLYKYQDRYGDGGFKRLLNQGFSCENTMIRQLQPVAIPRFIPARFRPSTV